MSGKKHDINVTQYVGIGLFVFALAVFIGSLTMSNYELNLEAVKTSLNNDYHYGFVEQNADMMQGTYGSSFAFIDTFEEAIRKLSP